MSDLSRGDTPLQWIPAQHAQYSFVYYLKDVSGRPVPLWDDRVAALVKPETTFSPRNTAAEVMVPGKVYLLLYRSDAKDGLVIFPAPETEDLETLKTWAVTIYRMNK